MFSIKTEKRQDMYVANIMDINNQLTF
jgi:hypothetical protein